MKLGIPKELLDYRGKATKPPDFDEFWSDMKKKTAGVGLDLQRQVTDYHYKNKIVEKITFKGLDQTVIYGWYIYHSQHENDYCLITTHGYKSSKKEPYLYLHWLDIGYDVLVFDLRSQSGETGNNTPMKGPMTEVITLNCFDKNSNYLALTYSDMMIASRLPKALGYESFVFEGTSQAGGMAVAMGCLTSGAKAVLANVPSNSDIDQRIEKGAGSFKAFQKICANDPEKLAKVCYVLSYFDTKNLVDYLKIPLYASVGGIDTVCPAKAFMATYNRIASPKEIYYYPFNGHEGGGSFQTQRELEILQTLKERKTTNGGH